MHVHKKEEKKQTFKGYISFCFPCDISFTKPIERKCGLRHFYLRK